MFVMVDDVREMTVTNSCKSGKYRSFEHLLFLCYSVVTTGAEDKTDRLV